MKATLLGDSNSIAKGWKESLDQKLELQNLSVGASCSGVHVCTLLNENHRVEGDVVVLASSINDENALREGETTLTELTYYIEWLCQTLIQENKIPIFLIMPNKSEVLAETYKNSLIYSLYRQLSSQYNIPLVDGYRFTIELHGENKMARRKSFVDAYHLTVPVASLLGNIINSLILDTLPFIPQETAVREIRDDFVFLPAKNLTLDPERLMLHGTSLRKEEVTYLEAGETLAVSIRGVYLSGLYIDINSIISAENPSATLFIETQRGVYTQELTNPMHSNLSKQFKFIPFSTPILCNEALKISFKESVQQGHKLLIVGLLFYRADFTSEHRRWNVRYSNENFQHILGDISKFGRREINKYHDQFQTKLFRHEKLELGHIINELETKMPNARKRVLKLTALNTLDIIAEALDTSAEKSLTVSYLGKFTKKTIEENGEKRDILIFERIRE